MHVKLWSPKQNDYLVNRLWYQPHRGFKYEKKVVKQKRVYFMNIKR
jgi:hypothetical protein